MSLLKDPKNQKLLNDFLIEHAPLIQKHINILKSKNMIPPSVDPEDLHFAGFHGLMDALSKYNHDVARNTSSKEGENVFGKYAERRIQGKMLDHIAAQDPVPKSLRTKAKNMASAQPAPAPQAPVQQEQPAPLAPPATIKKP